jgi:PKD repeat protein
MTIARTGPELYSTVIQAAKTTGITLTNNILMGPTNAKDGSAISAVVFGDVNMNKTFKIENNLISGGQYGIYLWNKTEADVSSSTDIFNNSIEGATRDGITIGNGSFLDIKGNTVTLKNGGTGITVINFIGSEVFVQKNRISSPTSSYAVGIAASDLKSFPNTPFITITNNFISIAGGSGSMGIWTAMPKNFVNAMGSYYSIYHNNINLTADDATTKGILVTSDYNGTYDIINNSVVCKKGYAIYAGDNPDVDPFVNCDHNNLYTEGPYTCHIDDVDYVTVGDWRDARGLDGNSFSEDPEYTTATDLHVASAALDGTGMYVYIDDDIDGQARDKNAPDIGADEFTAEFPDGGIASFYNLTGAYCYPTSAPIIVLLKNYGDIPIKSAVITYTVDGTAIETIKWKGDLGVGKDTFVSLDTFLFPQPSTSAVAAYTSSINGVTDLDASNDKTTTTVNVYKPDAGFVYGERAGNTIAFRVNDKTMSTISWNFGDGNSSMNDEPVHAYSSPGTYAVTHVVKHPAGCLTSIIQEVTVTGTAGMDDKTNVAAVNIAAYPNPFTTDITIEYSLDEFAPVTLKLIDVSGRVINEYILPKQAAGNYSYTLDGAKLKAGVYILKLETGNSSAYSRILKK